MRANCGRSGHSVKLASSSLRTHGYGSVAVNRKVGENRAGKEVFFSSWRKQQPVLWRASAARSGSDVASISRSGWYGRDCGSQSSASGSASFGLCGGGRVARGCCSGQNTLRCLCSATTTADQGGQETFTVTTPLYYANASPHMGSAYPTMAADALARYHRLRGRNVRFVTGTDEHGEKIALSAEGRGLSPDEHVEKISNEFRELWTRLDIQYDSYVRTTQDSHKELVSRAIERVWEKGDIYKSRYEGHYCIGCEEYKADSDLLEGNVCPIHQTECVVKDEENYFFRLSKYQKDLEELFENNPEFVMPEARRNEVVGWVKSGLKDFSISRGAVEWGIKFPTDPSQTVYVWFDALFGYVSALLGASEEGGPAETDAREATKSGWPADVHIIGKDILRFHAVYWPAMLMAADMPLPKQVFGHGFLTKDGLKMGKSLGNVLEPTALVSEYGSDAVRYYFLKEINFGQDGNFEEERFVNIVNANLANDIGNCLNRTLTLLKKNCASALPLDSASVPVDHPVREVCERQIPLVPNRYESLDFAQASEAILAISGRSNQYLEESAPWTLFKSEEKEDRAKAEETLVSIMEALRIVAIAISPITPRLSGKIYTQLGLGEFDPENVSWEDTAWGGLRSGQKIAKPKPVFARLEMKTEEVLA
ncbi:methionine--tRNA ligase [Chloropicon primus]|uniref:methionine--tRNA ligase n=1 Tax=Chloropicon primus TaxID=1764295 RepID=A0A5B8MK24_9CHLO|nr:methionine--tRNA ligase [Chloropicon primus]UPR00038.1 methionine--tRNA ligase [Chloropicon primus]|eukprot:QDZ20826.1 methionine--tRNA ligase [Chloropicon primus]